MTVRPPKQMWIGRPHERRLEVLTNGGTVSEEDLPAEEEADLEDDDGGDDGARRRSRGSRRRASAARR